MHFGSPTTVAADAGCAGVILAGGSATRFGGMPKGLATVGGVRIVDRVADSLRGVADSLLLVANDPAADGWLRGVRRIADLQPGLGPLAGVHAALTHLQTPVLVVGWDMPFVPKALLTELRRLGALGHVVVVPESADGQLEPTCAFYGVASRVAIGRWLEAGRREATAFIEQCDGVLRIPVAEVVRYGEPTKVFFSVNTPSALTRADALSGDS